MNGELQAIDFYPGEDDRATLIGSGLPFHHAKAEIRTLPGNVVIVTLRADIMAERSRIESPRSWIVEFIKSLRGLNGYR